MVFDDKQYEARIRLLFEKHQSVQAAGFSSQAYKPGLDSVTELDRRLGSPSGKLKVIHVAGTNGKGTVSSMVASLLSSMGLRVGLYTSPHLVDFRERIKCISGGSFSMIPRQDVWDFLDRLDEMPDEDRFSFFEVTTAMAFDWFAKQNLDCVVLECGLGGRLDSTNIVTPVLSIVSSIGLDHCAILGNTRSSIAAEKAGIFKKGIPALVASRDVETAPVFLQRAESLPCDLYFADGLTEDSSFIHGLQSSGECSFSGWSLTNARTVFSAMKLLSLQTGTVVGDAAAAVVRALEGEASAEDAAPVLRAWTQFAEITGLQGRWTERCQNGCRFIFDIGHNPPALKLNFERLAGISHNGAVPVTIIYGVMSDKDIDAISHLFPAWADYLLVAPQTRRALPSEALKQKLAQLRPDLKTRTMSSVAAAVQACMPGGDASHEGGIIYVGGSTFVVSEAII